MGDAPAVCGQVQREQRLLAAEVDIRVEAVDREEGVAADDGRAGEEAEYRGARQVGIGAERGVGEDRVQRVGALLGADEGVGDDDGEPGVGVEEVRGGGEGARLPHEESSSLKAMQGVVRRATPRFRAAAPRLVVSGSTSMPGWRVRTAAGVPSVEALSTTTIGGCSGRARSRSRV